MAAKSKKGTTNKEVSQQPEQGSGPVTDQILSLHSLEGWLLVGWVILLVYGLTQAFGARFRGRRPGLKSIVVGFALLFAWIGTAHLYHPSTSTWIPSFNQLTEVDPKRLEWLLILFRAFSGALFGLVAYFGVWYGFQEKRKRKLLLRRLRSKIGWRWPAATHASLRSPSVVRWGKKI